MSKIRNLFKKIFKKKKSDQDLEEIFYEESELGEETVILPDNEVTDYVTAPPHPNQAEDKIPVSSDLDYPESDEEDLTETKLVPEQHSHPAHTPMKEMSYSTDDDDLLNQLEEEEDFPEFKSFEEESLEAAQEEDDEEDFYDKEDDEYEERTGSDFTDEIDLEHDSISLRDRVEHLGTRVKDRFRNLNTKDLNQVYKNKKLDLTGTFNFKDLKQKSSNVNWSQLPNNVFDAANKPKYHRWFQVAMLSFFVIGLATIIGKLVSGSKKYNEYGRQANISIDSSQQLKKDDLQRVQDANLFQTEVLKVVEKKKDPVNTQTACTSASKKSSINAELVDTIVLQDSVKSIASVQMRSKKQLLIGREGDVLNNNMKIGKIESHKVIFRNLQNQDCEYIEQKQSSKKNRSRPPRVMSKSETKKAMTERKKLEGITQDGNEFKIKRAFLKSKLTDINTLLTQARGIQMKNPDGTLAFKIVDVDPGGIFAYLGVQDEDIITQINGEPIKELSDVMNLFGKVSSLSNLSLSFKRGGEEVTQSYTIE